jgi:hypothetical protein
VAEQHGEPQNRAPCGTEFLDDTRNEYDDIRLKQLRQTFAAGIAAGAAIRLMKPMRERGSSNLVRSENIR